MNKERITGEDNSLTAAMKLADNNPGAIQCLSEILQQEHVDPQNFMGPINYLLMLDSFGIYGTDIYILWSDICRKNTVRMMACIRATQLGLFPASRLAEASHRQDRGGIGMVPVDDLYYRVKERLPSFDSAPIVTV